MTEREGPKVTVTLSCRGCKHEKSEYFCVQGYDYSCTHPAIGDKAVGSNTPKWCPLLPPDTSKDARLGAVVREEMDRCIPFETNEQTAWRCYEAIRMHMKMPLDNQF